jgi:hypothetical protein
MAGSGYKLYATGDILTAAQVNNYLQEQTVMVFADAATRTTALASVVAEGMISYLKDTDSLQYYTGSVWTNVDTGASPLTTKGDLYGYSTTNARVPVGTNGQVLTADSTAATGLAWSTAASGGMTVLASGSLSTGTLSLTSISASYKNLQLVFRDWYPSTDAAINSRVNNASAASSYSYSGTFWNGTTTANIGGLYSSVPVSWVTVDGANYRNALVMNFPDYANTTANKFIQVIHGYVESTGAAYNLDLTTTMWNDSTAAAINRIDVYLSAGTFSGGTYILYGVN